MSAAVVLLGLGLLVWPVPGAAERRLGRLRSSARLAAGPGVVHKAVARDRSRVVAGLVVGVGAVAAALAAGPAVGVAAGAALAGAAVVVLAARAARGEARCRRDLLTALALLGGELDAGAAFPAALQIARDGAGAAAGAFDLEVSACPRGDLLAATRRCLTAGAGLVAVTGASWSAVVAGTARDVAARDARDREVASALAGARASTVVLAVLPALGIGLAAALGADPVGFLLRTPTGSVVLAAGAVLDLLGVLVSAAVAGRAAR